MRDIIEENTKWDATVTTLKSCAEYGPVTTRAELSEMEAKARAAGHDVYYESSLSGRAVHVNIGWDGAGVMAVYAFIEE